MDVILHMESLQAGEIFVKNIDGRTVTFQIVSVRTSASGKTNSQDMSKEELLQALETRPENLKGSILKDEDPFEPAVPESDWDVYKP